MSGVRNYYFAGKDLACRWMGLPGTQKHRDAIMAGKIVLRNTEELQVFIDDHYEGNFDLGWWHDLLNFHGIDSHPTDGPGRHDPESLLMLLKGFKVAILQGCGLTVKVEWPDSVQVN